MGNININGSGTYSSLEAAMNSASTNDTINITGTWSTPWDTTQVIWDVAGLTVTCDSDSEYPGASVATPTYYTHRVASGHAVVLSVDITLCEKVEFGSASTGTSDELFRIGTGGVDAVFKKCNFHFKSRNDQQDAFYFNNIASGSLVFENCQFVDIYRSCVGISVGSGTFNIDFNSCHGYNIGHGTPNSSNYRAGVEGHETDADVNVEMVNCLWHLNADEMVCVSSAYTGVGTYSLLVNNCLTSSADWYGTRNSGGSWTATIDDDTGTDSHNWTDTDPGSANDYVVVEDTTTSGPYYDLSLKSNAYNEAQDVTSDPTPGATTLTIPNTDIVGTARPQNANYDMGPFEIVSGGGGGNAPTGHIEGPLFGPLGGPI